MRAGPRLGSSGVVTRQSQRTGIERMERIERIDSENAIITGCRSTVLRKSLCMLPLSGLVITVANTMTVHLLVVSRRSMCDGFNRVTDSEKTPSQTCEIMGLEFISLGSLRPR